MDHTPLYAASMLATHEQRVALIRQCANEATAAEFDDKWRAVLLSCANWFSSMPLTADLHAEAGGAFRATVETAYYAMRLAGGQKFGADLPSERRRVLEPQYNYALFLAACCSWLDEPCRHFHFHRLSDGSEWIPAAHGPFGAWLDGDGYRVIRREVALPLERMRTALLAREILAPASLNTLDSTVLPELFGAINPEKMPTGVEALMHKVVRQAISTVTTFEQKAQRAIFTAPTGRVPPAADLVAAMPSGASAPAAAAPVTAAFSSLVAVEPTPSAAAGVSALFEQPTPANGDVSVTAVLTNEMGSESRGAPSETLVQMKSPRRADPGTDPFGEALGTASNLMREFFRAIAQDVAAGKVTVTWVEKGLAIPKRLLGSYGIASDTLVENLRKHGWLYKVQGSDILLVERIGQLICPRAMEG
jgi:conjugal transfer pilus assembly protein TraI